MTSIIKYCLIFLILSGLFHSACNTNDSETEPRDDLYLDSLLINAIEISEEEDFELALNKLYKVIEEAESAESYKYVVLGYNNLGLLYYRVTESDEALNHYFQSLDIAKEHKLEQLLNTIYNNIGIIYSSNGDIAKANEYFRKALLISTKRKEDHKKAINLVNIGTNLVTEKKIDSAFIYYYNALEILLESDDNKTISIVYNNLGGLYLEKNNLAEAKKSFRQAITFIQDTIDNFYYSDYLINLGKTYYEFHDYDSALYYLNKSVKIALDIHKVDIIIEGYAWLGKTNQEYGFVNDALTSYNKCIAWKDTLLSEKEQKWVSEMQMKYEFGKKEKKIEFIKQQAKRMQITWIIIIVAVIFFGGLILYLLKMRNINLRQKNIILKKDHEVSEMELKKQEAENKCLHEKILAGQRVAEIEKEKLVQQVSHKKRELVTNALYIVNKNEILLSIGNILDNYNEKNEKLVKEIRSILNSSISLDKDWESFKMHFEEVHGEFFSKLQKDFPALTTTDLRICAYLLINLSPKEIARIFNISSDSIRKRKQRLREKLNLSKEEDIIQLLDKYNS